MKKMVNWNGIREKKIGEVGNWALVIVMACGTGPMKHVKQR